MFHRLLLSVASALLIVGNLRADQVAELIEIHVEAIGGRARVDALKSIRASGVVEVDGTPMRFVMCAARPNQLRLETAAYSRTLYQGFDGVGPAWELDTGTQPPQPRAMAEGVAKQFVADAEFDDPLIGGATRGYVFDDAGEMEIEGRKSFRVLVTRNLTETFTLVVDSRTYCIIRRIDQRTSVAGRKLQVVTEFAGFRPVGGVLLAHQIAVRIDGRLSQQTRIEWMEANPALEVEIFSRPKGVPSRSPTQSRM